MITIVGECAKVMATTVFGFGFKGYPPQNCSHHP